jgi:hypothetical protein
MMAPSTGFQDRRMRNLLGRLHARRLPELLRIADAWSIPLAAETKGDVVATLYRAMIDPRAVRDMWAGLNSEQRAMAQLLAEAPDDAPPPTLTAIAASLDISEERARETALGLYRVGFLAREGDEDPLPIGEPPRLILPRELALQLRRIQDEMAAGNLAQAPLRMLIELLDDAELEQAARVWGLRIVPGVARRQEIVPRLLRLVNDRNRVERVVRGLGRDASAIWRVVRGSANPVALADVARGVGLERADSRSVARMRAALAELEGALLTWHAYRSDGSRWLFVPDEIRSSRDRPPTDLPPLQRLDLPAEAQLRWHSPDAVAWDLLTLLRLLSDEHGPPWEAGESPPRWLQRMVAPRLWYRGIDGVPTGYLELLQALALGEGVLALDDQHHPPRVVIGPAAREWRSATFAMQTFRLRERWLRLPLWVEGEPAGLVDVWGADWRGFRPRLLTALSSPNLGLDTEHWVTVESLAGRLATGHPSLLGPSFTAATARHAEEGTPGLDDGAERAAALQDVIAFELTGPFAWFGLTEIVDPRGLPPGVRLTIRGAALALRTPATVDDNSSGGPALKVESSGEVALLRPSPARVWALAAIAEQVELGPESHYRLTAGSIASALVRGIEVEQIAAFLEQAGRRPVPLELAENLEAWARRFRRVRIERALTLQFDDSREQAPAQDALTAAGWSVVALDGRRLLVALGGDDGEAQEAAVTRALQDAGFSPYAVHREQVEGLNPTSAIEAPIPQGV